MVKWAMLTILLGNLLLSFGIIPKPLAVIVLPAIFAVRSNGILPKLPDAGLA